MSKKRVHASNLKRDKVQRLLSEGGWIADESLTKAFESSAAKSSISAGIVYRHEAQTGILLVLGQGYGTGHLKGEGTLFKTHADFMVFVERGRKFQARFGGLTSWHILYKAIPQGEQFPTHVPDLITQLPTLLSLPSTQFDGTLQSLDRLNKVVKRIGIEECTEPPIFPALVAYAGETVRRMLGGDWLMRLVDDRGTWEPLIRLPGSDAIAVATLLMEGVDSDEGYPVSLTSGLEMNIRGIPLFDNFL